ncbi:hypothetical protein SNEBB_006986 [Seison nebaliae]|nr:hypothetical protein SNEBB_006986 [Seison nebaliae]
MYLLFEHASGYALFRVKGLDDIGKDDRQIEDSFSSYEKFKTTSKMIAFAAFTSGVNALENLNAISEGVLHPDLKLFLDTYLPNKKHMLGVSDQRLAATLKETYDISIQTGGNVQEITRCIRNHFHHFVEKLNEKSSEKAQLGLGHAYSRSKVQFNVNRVDNMVIQSIALLDQLDKDVNTFCMRIREWYAYHFPELAKLVPDNGNFAKCVYLIGDRNHMEQIEDIQEKLNEILEDENITEQILTASKTSMGMDISELDLINIKSFASRVKNLASYRIKLQKYLHVKVGNVAPNLSALIGDQVSARLISHAGSLTNLAKQPASTIQILGAEKALFRALKKKGNTPKYGLIYKTTFIGKTPMKAKGKISRLVANKCAIASRLDAFSDDPTVEHGLAMKETINDKIKDLKL